MECLRDVYGLEVEIASEQNTNECFSLIINIKEKKDLIVGTRVRASYT